MQMREGSYKSSTARQLHHKTGSRYDTAAARQLTRSQASKTDRCASETPPWQPKDKGQIPSTNDAIAT